MDFTKQYYWRLPEDLEGPKSEWSQVVGHPTGTLGFPFQTPD
jgi:hypothetical protein